MIADTFALISVDPSCSVAHRNKMLQEKAELRIENASIEDVLVFTDASWELSKACIAGIVNGIAFLSWHQKCRASNPTQAEARAILLASSAAAQYRWKNIGFFTCPLDLFEMIIGSRKCCWGCVSSSYIICILSEYSIAAERSSLVT